jgi:hypothetical protein
MKYYHRAWPIDAFLKQYLGSSAAKYRKDIQKLGALDDIPSHEKTVTSKGDDRNTEHFVNFSSSESESDDESDENMDEVIESTTKVSYILEALASPSANHLLEAS